MKQLSDSQRKVILGAGIVALVASILTAGITIGRGSGSPVAAPLLFICGVLLVLLAKKK